MKILVIEDDADMRLTPKAEKLGLASPLRLRTLREKQEGMARILDYAEKRHIKPTELTSALEQMGTTPLRRGCRLLDLISRPQVSLRGIAEFLPELKALLENLGPMGEEIVEAAEVQMKYSGYIERERQIAEKMQRLEHIKIRGKFDYSSLQCLSTEARQKLEKIDPETLAQAGRIPGVSPSDISVLLIWLNKG